MQNNNNEQQQEAPLQDVDDEVADPAEPRVQVVPEAMAGSSSSSAAGPDRQQQDLDSLIARMQRDMDIRLGRGSVEEAPFLPLHDAEQQAEGSHSSNTLIPTFSKIHISRFNVCI